uniref:Uncharacterized protein n=1 Tax=Alexandrium andersonii TaxID=327968 RepID=A0A7S2BSC2_9DINO
MASTACPSRMDTSGGEESSPKPASARPSASIVQFESEDHSEPGDREHPSTPSTPSPSEILRGFREFMDEHDEEVRMLTRQKEQTIFRLVTLQQRVEDSWARFDRVVPTGLPDATTREQSNRTASGGLAHRLSAVCASLRSMAAAMRPRRHGSKSAWQ